MTESKETCLSIALLLNRFGQSMGVRDVAGDVVPNRFSAMIGDSKDSDVIVSSSAAVFMKTASTILRQSRRIRDADEVVLGRELYLLVPTDHPDQP